MSKVGGGGIVDGGDRRECNRRHEKYHIRRYEKYHIRNTEGTHQIAGLSDLMDHGLVAIERGWWRRVE